MKLFSLACLGLVLLAPRVDAKAVTLGPEDDWFSVLHGGSLKPGAEVVLSGGTYADRRRLEMRHRGTRDRPVVIRAADGARVVFKRPDARQNTINMAGCQYLVLRGIEITGGAAGIRIYKSGSTMSKFVTLERLHIHHIGGVAVTANNGGNTYEGLVFRRNHIHHTGGHGEGFYLGCNNAKDGSTPGYVFNSVVEGNYIHHLKGGTVSQGDGIEIKDGSFGNVIRDNVIHDTKYPGIIVYGTDGKAPNIIERNAIWNTGDHGIQAAADAIIRNNIIRDSGADGIHCRNHQSAIVGNLRIVHNTIMGTRGNVLRIAMPKKPSGRIVVANNALYGAMRVPSGSQHLTLAGNAVGKGKPPVFPTSGSMLVGAADSRFAARDDFNGTDRRGSEDIGAYRYREEGNPGWKIGSGFKKIRGY